MVYLTKTFHFCAAHQYGHSDWSEEKNFDFFGEDVRVHGHNYILEITIKGRVNPETGFIFDLTLLKNIVDEHIIKILDHAQIEKDIKWFSEKQPSSENLVVFIWETLEPLIKVKLHRIRLIETPTIKTDYFGEKD